MSTHEIIIYITLSVLVVWYAQHVIHKAIKKKRIKDNKEDAPLTITEDEEEE